MAQAAILQNRALGFCDGYAALARTVHERDMRRAKSAADPLGINAYFPQLMSVISLPDRDETVSRAVDAAWEFLEASKTSNNFAMSEESEGQSRSGRDQSTKRLSPRSRLAVAAAAKPERR